MTRIDSLLKPSLDQLGDLNYAFHRRKDLSRLLIRNADVLHKKGNDRNAHGAYACGLSAGIEAEELDKERAKLLDEINRQERWGGLRKP